MEELKEMPKQADIVMSAYRVVEKYRGFFELGEVIFIAVIIMVIIPWLCACFELDKVRVGLFIIAGISCAVLYFISIPCFFLSHSPKEINDEWTSHNAKSDKFFAYVCALLSISSLVSFTSCGIFHLIEHHEKINVIWIYALPIWVVVCSFLGYQVWKRIGENLS